ncbi:MAG: hypothetical protein M0Q22_02720 [Sulfuritalea sp.]|jgi:hypothetical protein|nr:hypothetical protein [Sulfuritalea sp.]
MKKMIIALSLCAASSVSMAAANLICNDAAGNGTPVEAGSDFVKSAFTPKCSANTYVDFQQSASAAAAGAASKKGNQVFAGHTNGGSVAVDTSITCASSGCTAGNATSAAATALTNSSS